MAETPLTIQKPNKTCKLQGQWHRVQIDTPGAYVRSLEASPSTLYYTYSREQPNVAPATLPEARRGLRGFAVLDAPGTWWVYWVAGGSSAVNECYVVNPIFDLRALRDILILEQALGGIDIVRWGSALLQAGGDADGDSDFTKAMIAAKVDSRTWVYDRNSADFGRLWGDLPSNSHGIATNAMRAAYALAILMGRDSSDSTNRLIEARAAAAAQANTLYRLLVDSYTRNQSVSTAAISQQLGGVEIAADGSANAANFRMRGEGYWASYRGRRYRVGTQDLTGVAAATAYVATTPTYLLVNGSTKEAIVDRITISLPAIGTSTSFQALIKTDTANRLSAGGTTVAAETLNPGNAVASDLATTRLTPTATAEGGGTRGAGMKTGQIVSGSVIEFLYKGGLIIPAGGSLLVYVITATAGATVHVDVEFEEANVQ